MKKNALQLLLQPLSWILQRFIQSRNPVETLLGALVLCIALFFLGFAYSTADLKKVKGYKVTASFLKVGGLTTGSDVKLSGIKIGSVETTELDKNDFSAIVVMSIKDDIQLPIDTEASIISDGLLGDKYVKLTPGTESEFLKDGSRLAKTTDFKALEDTVGEIIFLATSDDKKKDEK